MFGDICQASLLHLTKAAVSFLNSFSGHIIIGPEKAMRGARVQSISLRLFSIERSLFLRTFVHVARYFTPEVMLQCPLISALKSVKKACTETIKYFPIGACDYEIVK